MCGIAGILNSRPGRSRRDEMAGMLTHMLGDLEHRGPDGQGMMVNDIVALGHRRLAIIDLSDSGKQPMHNAEHDISAVVNGEVYNYRTLTEDLKAQGYKFQSSCDSEVFVHGYQAYGAELFSKCNGMWALAIWDDTRKELVLSRDRIGVKPLYYLQTHDYFIFASEIKALLCFLPRPVRYRDDYLFKLLEWHTEDPEKTPYEAIRALPAASLGRVGRDGTLKIEPYWALTPSEHPVLMRESEAVRKCKALLADAVSLRMISDAPVAFFLSGGLDSAAVVAAATRWAGPGLATVSSIYEDRGYNEGRYIRDLIRSYGARPTVIAPEPNGSLLDTLRDVVWHLDGPSASHGTFLQWHLFKAVRELGGCKVVLSGNGGDEVHGGYHPYYRMYLNSLVRDYHRTKDRRYLLRFLWDAVMLKRRLGRNYVFNYPEFSFHGKARERMRLFRQWLARSSDTTPPPALSFLNAEFRTQTLKPDEKKPRIEFIEEQTVVGLRHTIMPPLLKQEDRMSMAWSVEARQPWLDYRLVEFLVHLDYRLRTRGVSNKHLTRMGMKGMMPRSVRKRVDKMGLPTPLARWLRTTERESCIDFIEDAASRHADVFDRDGMRQLLRLHLAEQIDASKQLYIIITTAIWLDQVAALNRQSDFWDARKCAASTC